MNNPLDVTFEAVTMKGRSHYWGEIYLSLSDKQIEHANLTEDVLMNTSIQGQDSKVGYTIRYITFEKIEK